MNVIVKQDFKATFNAKKFGLDGTLEFDAQKGDVLEIPDEAASLLKSHKAFIEPYAGAALPAAEAEEPVAKKGPGRPRRGE